MQKTMQKFFVGQIMSLALGLAIEKRERIKIEFMSQLLLELVFDVFLYAISAIAAPIMKVEKEEASTRLLLGSTLASLSGDFLFFICFRYVNDYMCTFFDQMNYPIAVAIEYMIYGRYKGSYLNFVAYMLLTFLTVGLCFWCSDTEKFRFHPLGCLIALLFNLCYVADTYIQLELISTSGVVGYARLYSLYRLCIVLPILLVMLMTRYTTLRSIYHFYAQNKANTLLSTIYYLFFYFISTFYIRKFDVPVYLISLISSSIYILLAKKIREKRFDARLFAAIAMCLALMYFLILNSK